MGVSTQISNATKHTMKLRVGYPSNLATIAAGGKYDIAVDFNATYREYSLWVDAPGLAELIVSSDDLADYKCITIKEEGGKLNMEMDPRQDTAPTDPPGQTSKKSKWIPAFLSRSER